MSRTFAYYTDSRKLGWLAAAMLLFFLSHSAWSLNLDHSIATQEREAQHLVKTLGRGKLPDQRTSRATKKKVYYVLIKAPKRKKLG